MPHRFSIIVPKRGVQRTIQKRPASKKSLEYKKTPYVRDDKAAPARGPRKEKLKCQQNLVRLLRATDSEIVKILQKDGMLPDWKGKECPRCGKGLLSGMMEHPTSKNLCYRCNKKGCQVYIKPTHLHPWLTDGRGTGHTPLQIQASVLLMKLQNVSTGVVCQTLDVNHKLVEDMATRLTYARQDFVQDRQKDIQLGSKNVSGKAIKDWVDVEGDEASFIKSNMHGVDPNVEADKPIVWEQWLGLVQRGRPESLILERLTPPSTEVRAPGPGAVGRLSGLHWPNGI